MQDTSLYSLQFRRLLKRECWGENKLDWRRILVLFREMILNSVPVVFRLDDLNLEIKSNGVWSSRKQRSCMEEFDVIKKS